MAGICPRTLTAACLKYMSTEDFREYAHGHSTKAFDSKKTWKIIHEWVELYQQECQATLDSLEGILKKRSDESRGKVTMLLRRWQQIKLLCEHALEKIDAAAVEV